MLTASAGSQSLQRNGSSMGSSTLLALQPGVLL
jgi:hypothetical protein